MKKQTLTLVLAALLGVSGCCDYLSFSSKDGKSCCSSCSHHTSPSKVEVAPSQSVAAKATIPSGETLVSIDGKPVLTVPEFKELVENAAKHDPYLSQLGMKDYDSVPPYLREQLLESVVDSKVISVWGEKEGIKETKEYREELEKTIKHIEDSLVVRSIERDIVSSISVTEADIQKAYEKYKEQFTKKPAMMTVVGASIENKEEATELFSAAKGLTAEEFAQEAERLGAKVTHFEPLPRNPRFAMSHPMSPALRRAVLAAEEKETVVRGAEKDVHWVLYISSRTEAEYAELDEVRGHLEQAVRGELVREAFQKRIAELRRTLSIDIKRDLITPSTQSVPQAEESENTISGEDFAALLESLKAGAEESSETL